MVKIVDKKWKTSVKMKKLLTSSSYTSIQREISTCWLIVVTKTKLSNQNYYKRGETIQPIDKNSERLDLRRVPFLLFRHKAKHAFSFFRPWCTVHISWFFLSTWFEMWSEWVYPGKNNRLNSCWRGVKFCISVGCHIPLAMLPPLQ